MMAFESTDHVEPEKTKAGLPATDLYSRVFTQNNYLKHNDGIVSPKTSMLLLFPFFFFPPVLLLNHSSRQIIRDPEAILVPKLSGMFHGVVKRVMQ